MLNLALDALVALLLAIMIGYAAVLSRRLGALRGDRQQLEALVRSLDAAALRAQTGVAAFKEAAEQSGRALQQTVDQAQGLRSDLATIVDLGGGVADRLEAALRSRRDEGRRAAGESGTIVGAPGDRPEAEPSGAAAEVAGFPSRAERLLRRALDARR